MTLDINREQFLTFGEAAKVLPKRSGKRIHVNTIYRWHHLGVRGVRLEAARIGGRLCTSCEALQRFTDALSEARPTANTVETRRSKAVEASLDAHGL